MKVTPRNGRFARTAKRNGPGLSSSSESGGSRFNLLASLDEENIHKQGNPRTQGEGQPSHVSMERTSTVTNKRAPKAKSTPTKDKATAPIVSYREKTPTGVRSATSIADTLDLKRNNIATSSTSSIFASPAYKEANQDTSLGTGHSAVVLTSSADTTAMLVTAPATMPPCSNVPAKPSQTAFPPRPPDRNKRAKALHLNPTKFKVTKLKTRDARGAPSDELSKAITEALGRPPDSDDEMPFDEAIDSAFDDDSASDKSEREF